MKLRIISVFIAGIVLAGCSGSPETTSSADDSSLRVVGLVAIPAEAWEGNDESQMTKPGDSCFFGTDGNRFPDIDTGAQVTLRDSSGATVGLSRLGRGEHLFGWMDGLPTIFAHTDAWVEDNCVFEFVIEGVESSDNFFSVEVAGRGEVSYSRSDLTEGISLSIGG